MLVEPKHEPHLEFNPQALSGDHGDVHRGKTTHQQEKEGNSRNGEW